MTAKSFRRLVIDASVARASGDEQATFPTSMRCRDFLSAVRNFRHCMVLTDEIAAEWNRHQSRFARGWRVSMLAQKKVVRLQPECDDDFRDAIIATASTNKERDAILKDLHLIEAALGADKSVIALDETVRALLHQAAQQLGRLKSILWVNPDIPDEKPVVWLEQKAKKEKHRCLGYAAEA